MSSELRQQLESVRRDYRQARYPGDLSAQVLPRRKWRLVATVASGALAAAVALALWPDASPSPAPPPARGAESFAGIPLAPPAMPFSIPAAPAFPSWDQLVDQQISTTQEAV